MNAIVQELRTLTNEYASKFDSITDVEFSNKPVADKWSKKEVVGHLIDSAQNNLRRFIVSQYEVEPPNIVYDQNFWVQANGYQRMKKEDVVEFWRQMNLRICDVLENMPEQNYTKESNTGKTVEELHSLHWLASDYVKHMKHHINQVIPGSFDITYP